MQYINCPHCRSAFKVDEAGYAEIMNQVRNDQFMKELQNRPDEVRDL